MRDQRTGPGPDSPLDRAHRKARDLQAAERRRRRLRGWVRAAAIAVTALVVGAGVAALAANEPGSSSTVGATGRPASSAAVHLVGKPAPALSLPDTAGATVDLRSYRNRSNVILYFSEGAGCEACLTQMKAIENDQPAFRRAGFTVLPIVMDPRSDIATAAKSYQVRTPFLLDDGASSRAYGTLGTGMHADLPGHSFVVIDKHGIVRWSRDYPSMWLPPQTLLSRAKTAVG